MENQIKENNSSVLIVDDEKAILSSLRSLFRKEGYQIFLASSGSEALTVLVDNKIDIIICDMKMPEMTGVQFLEKSVVASPGSLRIILSGYEDRNVVMAALTNGLAHIFLLKPWSDGYLKEIVKRQAILSRKIHKINLKDTLSKINKLPMMPNLKGKINAIMGSEYISTEKLKAEVEQNPAIVAKLLQVANSVYLGSWNRVKSVSEAIQFLGTSYVISLIAGCEVFDEFYKYLTNGSRIFLDELFRQSLEKAVIAKKVAEGYPELNKDILFLSCMFLDIGLIVRILTEQEEFKKYETQRDSFPSFYEAEKVFFGVTHDFISEALLEMWNFPKEIIEIVANHHIIGNDQPYIEVAQIVDSLVCGKCKYPYNPNIIEKAAEWKSKLQIKND